MSIVVRKADMRIRVHAVESQCRIRGHRNFCEIHLLVFPCQLLGELPIFFYFQPELQTANPNIIVTAFSALTAATQAINLCAHFFKARFRNTYLFLEVPYFISCNLVTSCNDLLWSLHIFKVTATWMDAKTQHQTNFEIKFGGHNDIRRKCFSASSYKIGILIIIIALGLSHMHTNLLINCIHATGFIYSIRVFQPSGFRIGCLSCSLWASLIHKPCNIFIICVLQN